MKKVLISLVVVGIAIGGWFYFNDKKDIETNTDVKPVVKIVALYPMSGNAAIYGETARKVAAKFMADWEVQNPNSKYKYEIVYEDIQLDPKKAVSAANRHVSAGDTDVFLSILSSVSQPLNPIAEKNKIITLNFALDPSVAKGYYNFRIAMDITKGSQKLINKMEKKGVQKVAIVNALEASNEILTEDILKQLSLQNKISVVGTHKFNPGERNFELLVQKIAYEYPNMIILETNPPEADLFLSALKKQGIKIPVTGWQFIEVVQNKDLAEGMFGVDPVGANESFIKEFSQELGGTVTYYAEYTYLMLSVITNAFENSLPINGKKVSTEEFASAILKDTNGLETPLGKINIDNEGNILLPTVIHKIINGKPVVVEE